MYEAAKKLGLEPEIEKINIIQEAGGKEKVGCALKN